MKFYPTGRVVLKIAESVKAPFIPGFLKRTLPFLTLDKSMDEIGFQSKINNRMEDSVDPDETAPKQKQKTII